MILEVTLGQRNSLKRQAVDSCTDIPPRMLFLGSDLNGTINSNPVYSLFFVADHQLRQTGCNLIEAGLKSLKAGTQILFQTRKVAASDRLPTGRHRGLFSSHQFRFQAPVSFSILSKWWRFGEAVCVLIEAAFAAYFGRLLDNL